MDIPNSFKKFFGSDSDGSNKKRWVMGLNCLSFTWLPLKPSFSEKSSRNDFRKFDQPDDDEEFFDLEDFFSEFHGNKFNFQGFPPNILKQFQEIFEAMQEFDDDPENGQRKRSFENKYNEFRQKTDTDLDGHLYSDQLDTLLKRISPEHAPHSPQPLPATGKKFKQPDEEKIMDMIHGTYREEIVPVKPRKRQIQKIPASPHHFGGLPPFDHLPPSSGRTWGKTVISIRKSDGTYETRKMERTPDGQTKTTITKTDPDGKSLTQTFTGDAKREIGPATNKNYAERNFTKLDGYTIPSLWWIPCLPALPRFIFVIRVK